MYSFRQIQTATGSATTPGPAYTRRQLAEAATAPHLSKLLAELRVDAARTDRLPDLPYQLFRAYTRTGDRMTYEDRYFERRRRLNSAAVIALVDADGEVVRRLEDILWEICGEYSWAVPAHHRFNTTLDLGYDRCIDLFAAETAHTLAEVVALLDDELDGPVVQRVRDEIQRRVLSPFLDEARSRWWETSTNNWAAVCAGAVGMAGLALEDDPLRLAALIDRVQRTMLSFLSGFGPDGGCVEGMDYWVYGYGYFVYYAHALRERTGLDLLSGTDHIARFPTAIDLGNGRCVSFSDGSDRMTPPTGLISQLSRTLEVPAPHVERISSFEDDRCYRWGHLSRTILWSDEREVGRPATTGTAWLPDLGWLVARGDGVAFAAKGGRNDEPHNQLDIGSFLLAVDGVQLLTDLGAGVYDADYFGPRRYEALHTSPAGHSVPRVDGVDQVFGPFEAKVVEYAGSDESATLELDLSEAYGGQKLCRRFHWDGRRLEMSDHFEEAGLGLMERFISRTEPRLRDGEVVWDNGIGRVTLRFGGDWAVAVEAIETRDHHAHPETIYRLTLTGTTAKSRRFGFLVDRV